MDRLPLGPNGTVPNHPRLPVLVARAALRGCAAAQIETHLAHRGWTRAWRNGIYAVHHYHSTAHEVLVIACGQARVTVGGEGGPQLDLHAGDVLVLPAGTAHRNDGSSADLLVVGAYAGGRDWDLCRPEDTDPKLARARIAQVPDWERDPIDDQQGR